MYNYIYYNYSCYYIDLLSRKLRLVVRRDIRRLNFWELKHQFGDMLWRVCSFDFSLKLSNPIQVHPIYNIMRVVYSRNLRRRVVLRRAHKIYYIRRDNPISKEESNIMRIKGRNQRWILIVLTFHDIPTTVLQQKCEYYFELYCYYLFLNQNFPVEYVFILFFLHPRFTDETKITHSNDCRIKNSNTDMVH